MIEKIPSGRAEAIGKFRTTERGDHQTSIKLDLTIVISSGERYAVCCQMLSRPNTYRAFVCCFESVSTLRNAPSLDLVSSP